LFLCHCLFFPFSAYLHLPIQQQRQQPIAQFDPLQPPPNIQNRDI
jgi:hypothetical protein